MPYKIQEIDDFVEVSVWGETSKWEVLEAELISCWAGPNSMKSDVFDGAQVVRAPSKKGIILFRRLIPSDEEYALINAERREAKCMPIKLSMY